MGVKFETKARKTWSLMERHLAADAIDFALQHYGIPSKDINLRVRFCGKTKSEYGLTASFGDRFLIKLYRVHATLEEVLTSVFHEVTHLKQGYEDELDMTWNENHGILVYWNHEVLKGEEIDWYEDAPWEVEARKAEETLLKLYLEEGNE